MTSEGQNATPECTAEYLAAMCEQLAALAERDGFAAGAYLLRMARLEFAERAEADRPPTTRANR
jgi:hypothetical protein